tara:strand:+ start:77 stop:535 length:459 start_codon:yes stop_codon:yes gene_type:complete
MILKLNKEEILFYQKNRDPFLMIDYVDELYPGKFANGYKKLKKDEWFFKVHWPGDPNMPGALQQEALTQMGALSLLTMEGNVGEQVYVLSANNIKYKHKIIPGDKLIIKTEIQKFNRGIAEMSAKSFVDDKEACSGEFRLILANYLKKFISI